MKHEETFSIIVPTFREAKNIPELIKRIAQLHAVEGGFEVILVDDPSQDGIEEVVSRLKTQYDWLSLISRKGPRSLSAAAMEGFQRAQYNILFLMDADLSHPPEKIPDMLAALTEPGVDFVIGSRYVQGGSADERWPVTRKISSRFAAFLAQLLITRRIQDPLSGFFAFQKATLLRADPIKPIGWKIGLELILKCRCQHIKEVPIHFSERLHGKSKFNFKVAFDYLRHVSRLLFYKMIQQASAS